MKRIELVRRKSLMEAGISNAVLVKLAQDNDYFKNRQGDTAFYLPNDAFMAFISAELGKFLPWRHVDATLNCIEKDHRNLYRLVKQNPDQFLVIEQGPDGVVVFPTLVETLRVWDWDAHKGLVMIHLGRIIRKVETMFDNEGLQTP